jgi:hypothetical protein
LCSGAKGYTCWNAASVSGTLARKKLVAAIRSEMHSLRGFDASVIDRVKALIEKADAGRTAELNELAKRVQKLKQQRGNLIAAIKEWGPIPELNAERQELDAQDVEMQAERRRIESAINAPVALPNLQTIRDAIHCAFDSLTDESEEFGRLMKKLSPEILVFPVRPADGGKVVLRAKLTLSLAAVVEGAEHVSGLREVLRRDLLVDLFDPPQRIEHMGKYLEVSARYPHKTLRDIAAEDLRITATAVQNIAAMVNTMRALGTTDPYEYLTKPPSDQKKLCRHLHGRYRFDPRPGFPKLTGEPTGDGESCAA